MLSGVPSADLSQLALRKAVPALDTPKRVQVPEETIIDLQADGADLATMLKMLSAKT